MYIFFKFTKIYKYLLWIIINQMLISFDDMLFIYLPKIILALFCGSLIGLERELKEKPAGIKTYMLICTGATLFTMVGMAFTEFYEPAGEPSRVAAQIVTGVGFLGAGTIIFAKGHVRGLTTAAAMWLSAAVGMAIGVGFYVFAVVVTIVVIIALIALGRVEERLGLKGRKVYEVTVSLTDPGSLKKLLALAHRSRGMVRVQKMDKGPDRTTFKLKCELTRKEMTNFQKALANLSGDVIFDLEN